MATFNYPEVITELSESADAAGADVEGLTTDLINFALMARVQHHFDEDGQLLNRQGLIEGSSEFVKSVLLAAAAITAAFCGEVTAEDEAALHETKH